MSTPTSDRESITAETDPHAQDPRLRGRTYAISFDRVWRAAHALADGGWARSKVLRSDDEEGVIEARSTTLFLRLHDDVRIDVGLDENAQTRIDLRITAEKAGFDLGRGVRLAGRFFRRLDRSLGATPSQILDATRSPTWSA